MERSWERQAGETDVWYDRFRLYLYMGPERSIASTHDFVTRLAKGAAHGQLRSWQRAARRNQWSQRAEAFDFERRKTMEDEERLKMVGVLLHQVYNALGIADLTALSKEEARKLLPTFRLFFRDLLKLHQSGAMFEGSMPLPVGAEGRAKGGTKAGSELSADDMAKFVRGNVGLSRFVEQIERVIGSPASEASWQPLRDVLAHLYVDEASARRIAAQALPDHTRIYFSPRAIDTWHAILTEATHSGRMEEVIRAAQGEYGDNEELKQAVGYYRQMLKAKGKR